MLAIGSTFDTRSGPWTVDTLLGRGKSGYSYRVKRGDEQRVLKVIHHEPVPFYGFVMDKTRGEAAAYERLQALGVPVPTLLEVNYEREYLLKAYVDGPIAAQAIADGSLSDTSLAALFAIANAVEPQGINLDYFPNNFVINGTGELVYIDYEINAYTADWSLANWGIWYWVNTAGMRAFLQTGDARHINRDLDNGLPITEGLEDDVAALLARFGR